MKQHIVSQNWQQVLDHRYAVVTALSANGAKALGRTGTDVDEVWTWIGLLEVEVRSVRNLIALMEDEGCRDALVGEARAIEQLVLDHLDAWRGYRCRLGTPTGN